MKFFIYSSLFTIALFLIACNSVDQENIAIGIANQQHAASCIFGGEFC